MMVLEDWSMILPLCMMQSLRFWGGSWKSQEKAAAAAEALEEED
jgi:hypothetical protein